MSEALRIHGGIDAAELARLGLERERVLDLSVNINPLGPHPSVLEAIGRASLDSYPDPSASLARAAIARSQDVEPARVLVGHGSAELLWSAVASLAGQARPLLIPTPTFSEPEIAARAWGVPVVAFTLADRETFQLDLVELERAIRAHDPAAVYLCQPNNPNGSAVPGPQLRALCEAHPRITFIVDQAFLSLSSRHAEQALRFGPNVLLVRSLTKDHALPGLRVGYALAAPALLQALDARRPSWMVSAPAQAAIVAACEQGEFVQRARDAWLADKQALAQACSGMGLAVVPSVTPFFLVRVGDADSVRARMLARHQILVRSARSFGLPEFIRIAGCSSAQLPRVVAALRAEAAP